MTRKVLLAITVLHLAGCGSPESAGRRDRYEAALFPEDYHPGRRIAGSLFVRRFGLDCEIGPGTARYAAGGRSVEIRSPPGEARPFLTLRLAGPGGLIERQFLLATGFGGPLHIPLADAEALGLTGRPDAGEADLICGGAARRVRRASVEVEFPALGLREVMEVIWSPPGR